MFGRRFKVYNNGENVPASLRYTIYDRLEDICVAAYSNLTKAIEDCNTFNRLYSK